MNPRDHVASTNVDCNGVFFPLQSIQRELDSQGIDIAGGSHGVYAVCEALDHPNHPRELLGGRHLLMVDDDESLMRMIAWGLYASGASISTATSGHKAIEAVAQTQFDLIIMDACMPEIDGFETTSQLRRNGYSGPIVMFTGYFNLEDIERAMVAGCQVYANKCIGAYHLLGIAHYLCKGIK